jgi:hypothetical protein
MTMRMFRVLATLAITVAGTQTLLSAQGKHEIEGTWDINVTVVNCQTGAPVRTVRSLQLFSHDGSLSETANTFLRGSSVGQWDHADHNVYTTTYWFFRYNADGTMKSIAAAANKLELSDDGNHFTATGTITDYDAAGNQISVGCVSHAARRLSSLED